MLEVGKHSSRGFNYVPMFVFNNYIWLESIGAWMLSSVIFLF